MKTTCFVYILRCDKKSFYTGLTNNMERRLKEHNTSKSSYTSKFKQKEIVFLFEIGTRKQARRLEVYIKSVGAKKFLYKYEKSLQGDKRTKIFNRERLFTT